MKVHEQERLADIVADCTDLLPGDDPDNKGPWRERKERYIEHLSQSPYATRLVSACDKLHNLRSLVVDLRSEGESTLSRFHATPAQTRWYYEQVRLALGDDLPASLCSEFDALLAELPRFISRAEPESEDR